MIEFLNVLDDEEIQTECVNNFEDFIQGRVDKNRYGLGVVHFNIRSLQKHFNELLVYVEMAKDILDVIILSETGKIKNIHDFSIPQFSIHYNEAIFNKCDGSIIYVRNNISVNVNIVPVNETKFLRAILTSSNLPKNCKIGLTAFYRLPATDLNMYLDNLEIYLNSIEYQNLEIYVGDINIDILKKETNETNKYLNIMNFKGFKSYINKPTRVQNESKTAIDHIFIRTHKNLIKNVELEPIIFHTDMTDHYSPFILISFPTQKNEEPQSINKVTIINFDNLKHCLSRENWNDVINTAEPQKAYDLFFNKLNQQIQKCTKSTIKTKNIIKLKPWITTGLILSIKNRDFLKKKLTKKYTLELENQYKNYRNKLHSLIRKTKNDYYQNKITQAGNDYKKIWKIINDITGSTKKTKQIENISIKSENNDNINNNKEKAEEFNIFFTNLGENMANKIHKVVPAVNFLKNDKVENNIFFKPVTKNEVTILISKLKNSSAPGPDKLTATTIKNINEYIILPVTHILNICFQSGKIPSQWKESIVTPVYKSGDPSELTNYRPISVINNFAKIFENAVKSRLINFFHNHNVITDCQYGFIQNSSTENAVVDFLEKTVNAVDESLKCAAVFLDLAKAFDTVSHNILLDKLNNYGIRGLALRLLRDYLSNRTQSVKIGNTGSSKSVVKMGVPQGTVLGPILFLVYMNNITQINNLSGNIICYADDTVIIFAGKEWEEVKLAGETALRKISLWLNNNLLTLNVLKTKCITFSSTIVNQPNSFCIKLHSSDCQKSDCNCPLIEKVSQIKYLGVILDQYIRWSEHIVHVSNRLRALMHKFYVLRDILSKKNIMILYNSLVESILRYCIVAWGGAFNTTIKIVETTQNIILKIILKKERLFSTNKLYDESNILNVKLLFAYQCIMRIYTNAENFTQKNTRLTRSVANMEIPVQFFKKSLSQRSLSFFGPKFFNIIPIHLRQIIKTKKFKIEIKKYLITNKKKIYDLMITYYK